MCWNISTTCPGLMPFQTELSSVKQKHKTKIQKKKKCISLSVLLLMVPFCSPFCRQAKILEVSVIIIWYIYSLFIWEQTYPEHNISVSSKYTIIYSSLCVFKDFVVPFSPNILVDCCTYDSNKPTIIFT